MNGARAEAGAPFRLRRRGIISLAAPALTIGCLLTLGDPSGYLRLGRGFMPKCTSVVAGKGATADHSVMLAHNEDLSSSTVQHYAVAPRVTHQPGEVLVLWSGARVPQAGETYAYIATKVFNLTYVPGDFTSGINGYQVAIVNNAAQLRDAAYPSPTAGRLLWSDFTRLALERAQTARQAVQIVGDLAQAYKVAGDSGTMFGITDPAEGWWIEIAQEGQWVAQRVPDDGAVMRANAFRIGVVDFADTSRFMSSPDLVTYAEKMGWYTSADGPFDFARAYGDPDTGAAEWNTHREERVAALLASTSGGLRPADLMAILRDHYEGTPYDLSDGYTRCSPHRTAEYTVCNTHTVLSAVFQSRSWLPPEIGAVCWRAMASPCASAYVPWYLGQMDVPISFWTGSNTATANSAYWAFRNLASNVDAAYGERITAVHDAWKEIETREATDQAKMEEAAARIYAADPRAARRMVTEFSDTRAALACQRARALMKP